jgi:meso-butanediol dehydrogenase/(S,S)-butanediol dehydrogenase/diacetyl reductase
MKRLAGRVCIVTGGAGGIGAGMARRLASDGAVVVIADLDAAKAREVAASIAGGPPVTAIELDVRDPVAFNVAVAQVFESHGRLDVLFNNAGIIRQAALDEITRERFDEMMSINVFSVIAGAQAAAAVMRPQGYGKIVNTCSVAGRRVMPGHSLYSVTKYSVRALTVGFAQELGSSNICVNAICPGLVHTPLWDGVKENGMSGKTLVDTYGQRVALGRAAQPEDIAGTAAFLASSDADYITGQLITVDGGFALD